MADDSLYILSNYYFRKNGSCMKERSDGKGQSWHISPVEPSVRLLGESEQSHRENMGITSVSSEILPHVATLQKNTTPNSTWMPKISAFYIAARERNPLELLSCSTWTHRCQTCRATVGRSACLADGVTLKCWHIIFFLNKYMRRIVGAEISKPTWTQCDAPPTPTLLFSGTILADFLICCSPKAKKYVCGGGVAWRGGWGAQVSVNWYAMKLLKLWCICPIYDDSNASFSSLLLSIIVPALEASQASLRSEQNLQACALELISQCYYTATPVLVLTRYLRTRFRFLSPNLLISC